MSNILIIGRKEIVKRLFPKEDAGTELYPTVGQNFSNMSAEQKEIAIKDNWATMKSKCSDYSSKLGWNESKEAYFRLGFSGWKRLVDPDKPSVDELLVFLNLLMPPVKTEIMKFYNGKESLFLFCTDNKQNEEYVGRLKKKNGVTRGEWVSDLCEALGFKNNDNNILYIHDKEWDPNLNNEKYLMVDGEWQSDDEEPAIEGYFSDVLAFQHSYLLGSIFYNLCNRDFKSKRYKILSDSKDAKLDKQYSAIENELKETL